MSGDELNPAAVAQPVEDVQGDGRWMSQVGGVYYWWRKHSVSFLIIHVHKNSICVPYATFRMNAFCHRLKIYIIFFKNMSHCVCIYIYMSDLVVIFLSVHALP